MASKNDITGDTIISRTNSELYDKNFDTIFGVKKKEPYIPPPLPEELQNLINKNTYDKMGT